MNWQTAIESIGGTAIIVAAVAWLTRSVLTAIINRDLESARTKLAKDSWHFQRSWTEQEKFFAGMLTSLYKLERALLASSEHFQVPGSEHDASITESEEFRKLAARWNTAVEEIHTQMGAASLHLPDRDYQKLEELFSALWNAQEDSICEADFIRSSLDLVTRLRKEIRVSGRHALAIEK